MEFQTHTLTAIVIYELMKLTTIPTPARYWIVGILVFFSHFITDLFGVFTYHPKDPHWDDKFWKGTHLYAFIVSIIAFVVFVSPYWWLMILGSLPDIIDWLILRPIIHRVPPLHKFIEWSQITVWRGFNLFETKKAFITEIIIDIGLVVTLLMLLI
jgi:hypothetical protein